MLEERPLLI
ncbi:hypothetical protein LB505_010238 [Fusarium chuoi]|nr:hypothetical protein LB505_010238 [Fusarium chuoi]